MIKELEQLFIDNNWTIIEGLKDEPIEGKTEVYDLSGMTFNPDFQITSSYLKSDNVVVHKMFKSDGTLFGNLRIYNDDPEVVIEKIIQFAETLKKENYAQFVKEIYGISEKLIFNDNGVWVKVNFSK